MLRLGSMCSQFQRATRTEDKMWGKTNEGRRGHERRDSEKNTDKIT